MGVQVPCIESREYLALGFYMLGETRQAKIAFSVQKSLESIFQFRCEIADAITQASGTEGICL